VPVIRSQLDVRAEEFRANAGRMKRLVADLQEKAGQIALGGDTEARAKHAARGKLLPRERGLPPGYEQKRFPQEARRGRLRLIAAGDGREGAVTIHQDADVWTALLEPGESLSHRLAPGRYAWLHVARGAVSLNGSTLGAGDGAAVSDEAALEINGAARAEVLLFDLN